MTTITETPVPAEAPAPTEAPAAAPAAPEPAAPAPLSEALYPEAKSEAKAEGDTPAEPAAPAEPEAPAALTAESYTFTLPEGIQVDDALLGEAKGLFATAGIAPEAAATLVQTILPKLLEGQVSALAAAQQEQYNTLQTSWVAEINALPDFKGETRKISEAAIASALDTFGPTVQREAADGTKKTVNLAREAMDITGAGNNPAIVQLILSMSKALSEGSPTGLGRPAGGGRKSFAETLYPTS